GVERQRRFGERCCGRGQGENQCQPPACRSIQVGHGMLLSSAESGRTRGSAAAGKIANSAIPARTRNDALSACSLASTLICTASSTCPGAALVLASTSFKCVFVTKLTWSRSTSVLSESGMLERLSCAVTNTLSRATATTLANAVPSAVERLFATPRSAPTSPANSLGDKATSTLNNSVSSAPSPIPATISPAITVGVPQSL